MTVEQDVQELKLPYPFSKVWFDLSPLSTLPVSKEASLFWTLVFKSAQ
jgi:hypothetical protein